MARSIYLWLNIFFAGVTKYKVLDLKWCDECLEHDNVHLYTLEVWSMEKWGPNAE